MWQMVGFGEDGGRGGGGGGGGGGSGARGSLDGSRCALRPTPVFVTLIDQRRPFANLVPTDTVCASWSLVLDSKTT